MPCAQPRAHGVDQHADAAPYQPTAADQDQHAVPPTAAPVPGGYCTPKPRVCPQYSS